MTGAMLALAGIGCAAGAAFLAYHDKAGWGWLIFLAFIAFGAATEAK